jgi:plasmid maintenance system antidote protein VapI
MNEGNRMTVVVYCPTSSSLYEDRRSFRKQLETVPAVDKVHIKALSKKQKKTNLDDLIIVRVKHDEHCKYESRLPGAESRDLPALLNQIMLLIESLHIHRALLSHAEQPPVETQMPLFEEEDDFNPFPRALRAMPRPLMLGRIVDALIAERDLTRAEVAEAVYVDEEFLSDLIAGELPEELIEDDLLVDLAEVLNVTPNILRIVLRRPVVHSVIAGHIENDVPEVYLDALWDQCEFDD